MRKRWERFGNKQGIIGWAIKGTDTLMLLDLGTISLRDLGLVWAIGYGFMFIDRYSGNGVVYDKCGWVSCGGRKGRW